MTSELEWYVQRDSVTCFERIFIIDPYILLHLTLGRY